ncbi:hypothetical protein EV356DRAFT_572335 [Viridothelium virens]|uniref:Apoptosis-inducing TAF9-like domain 1 family protein n=1 Tax=Viridothelium virens TaxID=1048519 RepID=A0A6A6HQ16_VIRVR|nr:hypothetical protein EV356DRAFT_572335 [Viridothelium virens]
MAQDADPAATEERLKSALWYSIGRIVDEDSLGLKVNATPQFIAALMEMTWAQIENVAKDLECFARHGNRYSINVSDVLLLARRNEGLETVLKQYAEELQAARVTASDARPGPMSKRTRTQ